MMSESRKCCYILEGELHKLSPTFVYAITVSAASGLISPQATRVLLVE